MATHNSLLEQALEKEKKLNVRANRIEDKLRAKGLFVESEISECSQDYSSVGLSSDPQIFASIDSAKLEAL